MWANIWAAIMASKGFKIGGGLLAGGSSLALIVNVLGSRIDDLDKRLDAKEREIKLYVDLKHDAVLLQLQFMNSRQVEMNDMLKNINERMYNERSKK